MKYMKAIGNVVTCIAVAVIFYKLFTLGIDISMLSSADALFTLLTVLVVYVLFVLFNACLWKRLISVTESKKMDSMGICLCYTKSNLMKYLPGNVFQYVGREQIAQIYHLDPGNVALASILEIICMMLAAVVVSVLLCGTNIFGLVSFENIKFILIVGAAMLLLLCLLCTLAIKKGVVNKFRNYMRTKITAFQQTSTYIKLGSTTVGYAIGFLSQGISFYFVLMILQAQDSTIPPDFMLLAGAYTFAWLLGYITPGSPGGLGVRELSMMAILSQSSINLDQITISLALARGINIIGDLAAFLVIYVCNRCAKSCFRRQEGNGKGA